MVGFRLGDFYLRSEPANTRKEGLMVIKVEGRRWFYRVDEVEHRCQVRARYRAMRKAGGYRKTVARYSVSMFALVLAHSERGVI